MPPLFVNAVEVQTGNSRVFGPPDMSIDALVASACAPLMFQAVEIEGKSYWDGSYGANPMLWPLLDGDWAADIFMLKLTPLDRSERPTSPKNNMNRTNEIASINALLSEMRELDQRNRRPGAAAVCTHVVSLDNSAAVVEQEPSIKRTVGRILFEILRQEGHAKCSLWLAAHCQDLGTRSSVDIRARYLAPWPRHLFAGTRPLPSRSAQSSRAYFTNVGISRRGSHSIASGIRITNTSTISIGMNRISVSLIAALILIRPMVQAIIRHRPYGGVTRP